MANETTMQTSCIQENHMADECRENIPPEATAASVNSQLKFQDGDVEKYSSTQPSGKNVPLSDTCTFSTPAPTSSNGGIKAKSRLSGLQSALTPILKFLNINNKCPSPDVHGNNPNPTDPISSFGSTAPNCQKSAGGSSQHPNSDFSSSHSGQSLGDTDAPVRWLHDEFLPEITLLDVTCDSTVQLTKNDSPLPDSVPSTPATTGSVKAFTTLHHSQSSASTSLNTTTQIPCPQTKTLGLLQSDVSSKEECQAKDQGSSVRNTTKTILAMNRNHLSGNTGSLREMQDLTFDRNSLQKSSDNTVSGEADTTNFCLQNNSYNSKPPSEQNNTITVSKTSSSDSHKTTKDKLSPPKICDAEENHSKIHPPDLLNHNGRIAKKDDEMFDIPENIDAPLCMLDDRYFPEITLLNVTRDSEFSPGGEMSALEVMQDISPVDSLQNNKPSSELSGQVVTEPGMIDIIQSEDLSGTLDGNATHTISSLSEQSDQCVGENTPKASLEATRDISLDSVLEDSPPSLEPNGQNMVKTQTSAEDAQSHPINVTRDISSSSDMSIQCSASQLSTSEMQCNTSLKNVTSELHGEPVVSSNTVGANNEELLTNHDTELTTKVPLPSPKRSVSVNSTFTSVKQSNLSACTSVNTTAPISCPQNKTLDLPQSNVNSPQPESDAKDRAASFSKNVTETSPCINQNCSAAKAGGPCDVQNVTFDRHSLQKSSGETISGEAGAATFCLQNNTFDTKSKQNGTITMSEMISSDSHQSTLDKSSPPDVCNATSSPKDNKSEVQPPEPPKYKTTDGTDPNTKMGDTPESTFEANPAVEVASGAGRRETKDHSQSDLPLRDGLSDSLGHQSMDMEEDNKANTLNLDDTLDLRVDSLITSTPMTNCKMFNFNTEREEGKTIGAQKKLYGDGPSKPNHVRSDVPSNIVCDRKTFLTQPTVKSLLPPLKASSQLLKFKPASILPGKFEPLMSGLPMTRQRAQAEALRNTAASDAPHVATGISSSYNLRTTTTGSKQPNPSLPKPRLSSISSGIHRTAPGLRPPSARSNAPASSSTEKLCGPTATVPATKILQAKKHPLTRGEALPIAKRKKIDASLPSVSAEASTSSCDAANKNKNLKQPAASQRALPAKIQSEDAAVPTSTAESSTSCNAVSRARALKQPVASHRALLAKPQGRGCAKCAVLEQQLEMKSEEIRRLKEELLKYSNQRENADMDAVNT